MKNPLLFILAAFVLTTGSAAAQAPAAMTDAGAMQGRGRMQGNPEEMAKRQTERLHKELGLNDAQATKVQQIMMARSQEMQAMRRGDGDRATMREQMQTSRAKYDAQLKEILNADQYAKLTSMEAERMNRGGGQQMDRTNIDKMKAKTKDGDKVKVTTDKVKVKSAE